MKTITLIHKKKISFITHLKCILLFSRRAFIVNSHEKADEQRATMKMNKTMLTNKANVVKVKKKNLLTAFWLIKKLL